MFIYFVHLRIKFRRIAFLIRKSTFFLIILKQALFLFLFKKHNLLHVLSGICAQKKKKKKQSISQLILFILLIRGTTS